MKDRVEVALVVRTDELSGKAVKAVAKVLGNAIKEVKPQLMRLVEKATQAIEQEIGKDEKKEAE